MVRVSCPPSPTRSRSVAERAATGRITCAGCGLLCDDVTVDLSGDAAHVSPECALGARWFTERARRPIDLPAATVDGEPAEVGAALTRAAELLRRARRPLIYGFDDATLEDARAAVALADRLGALVLTDEVAAIWPGAPALPLRGATTATLGEIRDRSRVLVIWREDPETTHPRLLERLGLGADTSTERVLIVVDDRDTPTAARATLRLDWPRERDLDALVTLHALVREAAVTGDLDARLATLLEHIEAAPHVAFIHGPGLTCDQGGQRRALALYELARSLSQTRHVVTMALPRAVGTTGAQDALAWQTGYAANVDLASGHPELFAATQPTEGVDVAVRIGGAPELLAAGVAEIALCSLPPEQSESPPAVSIRTAAPGVEAKGTAHRLDGVPLTLQAPMPGDAPTAAALLTRLSAEVGR
jgi:formylmethanofuran dehydrogenase subunit B